MSANFLTLSNIVCDRLRLKISIFLHFFTNLLPVSHKTTKFFPLPLPYWSIFDYNEDVVKLLFPFYPPLLFPVPTYDYRCDACSYEFEEFQYIKDKPLKKCPKCKKNKLRRLIGGGAAIVFHGSGFYQTDYRNDSYKNAAKADAAPKSDPPSTPPCQNCSAAGNCKVKN